MKKLNQILLIATLVFCSVYANAQSKPAESEAFFLGKWKLMVYGLPSGDTEMYLTIEKKDGALVGSIGGKDGSGANPLTKASIEKNTFNANFIGGGYNVPLYIDKKEDGTVEGSMNDMFDVKGSKMPAAEKK